MKYGAVVAGGTTPAVHMRDMYAEHAMTPRHHAVRTTSTGAVNAHTVLCMLHDMCTRQYVSTLYIATKGQARSVSASACKATPGRCDTGAGARGKNMQNTIQQLFSLDACYRPHRIVEQQPPRAACPSTTRRPFVRKAGSLKCPPACLLAVSRRGASTDARGEHCKRVLYLGSATHVHSCKW